MKNLHKEVFNKDIPPADHEFYVGGSWLTALGVVIAVVAI